MLQPHGTMNINWKLEDPQMHGHFPQETLAEFSTVWTSGTSGKKLIKSRVTEVLQKQTLDMGEDGLQLLSGLTFRMCRFDSEWHTQPERGPGALQGGSWSYCSLSAKEPLVSFVGGCLKVRGAPQVDSFSHPAWLAIGLMWSFLVSGSPHRGWWDPLR